MSSCPASPVKEKKFGVAICRERKCPDLQRDPKYPDSPQHCAVTHGMPGSMHCCVKEMDADRFIRHISGQLNNSPYDAQRPGVRNCPKECPYKIFINGEKFVFVKGKPESSKVPAKIGTCALTGSVLANAAVCPCNILGNKFQENQILQIKAAIDRCQDVSPESFKSGHACNGNSCPDGIERCEFGKKSCPLIRLPFTDLKECPLWRIPAKLLPAPAAAEPAKESRKSTEKVLKKSSGKKKEPEDPICKACRERFKGPVPEHACSWCKEEQEKHGRRAWTCKLNLNVLHLGDMKKLGEEIPDNSVDIIITDPPYTAELWEDAYDTLGDLAARVLKPSGFLFTYVPHIHLPKIMDLLEYSGTPIHNLTYFWIMVSLNEGPTAKNHKRNVICLHKPLLVYQKKPEKGAARCFADVIKGRRQKAYHPWQQSIHDVLGILLRVCREGDILLDPYAGTGTSLIAANLLGLDWIGFEIDPKTHTIAVRELQQQPLTIFSFDECDDIGPCKICTIECPDDNEGCKEFQDFVEQQNAEPVCTPSPKLTSPPADTHPDEYLYCGICGHHKGRKTFHDTCPRLNELLFKGGTKSAKVLMEETTRERCPLAIPRPEKKPKKEMVNL